MPRPLFPNLFIIGAMKAGTSSLHEYLHQHPQIFMSRFKEPQYFAPHTLRWGQEWGQGNPYPEPGAAWYLRLFADAGDVKYAGESSVSYSARPWVEGCERRIHAFNPHARIIYAMRDPVERALSHYWHFVTEGREDLDPLAAVKRRTDYLARSNYAMQLRPYLETFGADRVFTLTLEELSDNPADLFRRLFDWLGVDSRVTINVDDKHNVRGDLCRRTRRGMVWLDTMLKHWRWKRFEGSMPAAAPRILARLAYSKVIRGEVDVAPAIAFLREELQRPTAELCHLLDREFLAWTTLHSGRARGPDVAPLRDEIFVDGLRDASIAKAELLNVRR